MKHTNELSNLSSLSKMSKMSRINVLKDFIPVLVVSHLQSTLILRLCKVLGH